MFGRLPLSIETHQFMGRWLRQHSISSTVLVWKDYSVFRQAEEYPNVVLS